MRRDSIVETRPAVDITEVKSRAHRTLVALQDAERAESAAAEHHERKREEAARRRLEMGRVLVEARKAWPARGPKAKGWGEFLANLGITTDTALNWMKLAGHVEDISRTEADFREIPTLAEAGIKPKTIAQSAIEGARLKHEVEDAAKIANRPWANDPIDDEPMPENERAALIERLRVEADDRRRAAIAPLRMEARETAGAKILVAYEHCIETLNQLHAEGVHLTDCSASAADFERAKTRALTLFGIIEAELVRIDVSTAASPAKKVQLALLNGGKTE